MVSKIWGGIVIRRRLRPCSINYFRDFLFSINSADKHKYILNHYNIINLILQKEISHRVIYLENTIRRNWKGERNE